MNASPAIDRARLRSHQGPAARRTRAGVFSFGRVHRGESVLKRLFVLVFLGMLLVGCAPTVAPSARVSAGDQAAASAFGTQQSGVQLSGSGTVERILADDADGGRHQRFILRLGSGQTLLIAHNIDVAPRIPTLRVGDTVEYAGVYEWNSQGGVVHWTHHDPSGQHPAGWLRHNGTLYQ